MKTRNRTIRHNSGFFTIHIRRALPLLLLSMIVIAAASSCKKEIKAGEPIALTYDEVYMIGSATPAVWDINSAIAMTQTPGNTEEFTWEGPLVAGEVKFPTSRSWSSDTFMAAANGQSITDNKAVLTLNGSPDQKWLLTDADAGNYKITLNTKDQTVTFQKE